MTQDHGDRFAWRHGLSFRLFYLTAGIILLIELLIFVPSAAGERRDWLEDRVQAARIAALSLEAAPSQMVSDELARDLLTNAEVLSVAEMGDGIRERLLPARAPIQGRVKKIDLAHYSPLDNVMGFFDTLTGPEGRVLMIRATGSNDARVIEVLVPEEPLRDYLYAFSWRILGLSLLISILAGALVFGVLFYQVVRPVQRLTKSVIDFRKDPGRFKRRLPPLDRRDEIGQAQTALAGMEEAVSETIRQRERLAQLGEAIAKINHDLRNSLAAAQLTSESLARSEDPRVKRAAPRLERALERAITLAQQTLEYGRAEPPKPRLDETDLRLAAEYAREEALAVGNGVGWRNEIPERAKMSADPEHLHRALVNLIRNAAQAMSDQPNPRDIEVGLTDGALRIRDTGPGLPDRTRDNLFKPFAGSSKRDGSGLGLAIARELCRSMGGDLVLDHTGRSGTTFKILLPKT
ncbi:MAG: HAMP domain-containing sensor histidine kinase [Pseudomonadota bacterium]